MGWCSGTDIFDAVARWVLNSRLTDDEKYEVMEALTVALENHDWDCQSDSQYFKHPIVIKLMKELHDWDLDAEASDDAK